MNNSRVPYKTDENHPSDATPRLRPDLVCKQIRVGQSATWVLSDPLTRAFFHFSPRDYQILTLMNGRRTVREIAEICGRLFSPDFLPLSALIRFLKDAQSKGLIQPDRRFTSAVTKRAQTAAASGASPTLASVFRNPLAVRLPGINPDRWLSPLVDLIRPQIGRGFVVIIATIVLAGLLSAVVHFDGIAGSAQQAARRIDGSWIALTAGVILATKILHELAHAVTCKLLGGSCREFGVMLLAGFPCLYCDVSDAWLIKETWKRCLVSAAGIIAELAIASIATILWCFTEPSTTQDVCVTIMVVCSVGTVLVNANPLLRYDGYFILSDLCATPNLGAEASAVVRRGLRRLVWPSTRPQSPGAQRNRTRNILLGTYGVLSSLYRCFILAFLSTILIQFASTAGLRLLGIAVVSVYLICLIKRWVAPILADPPNRAGTPTPTANRVRKRVVCAVTCCLLCLLAWIPLPCGVTGTAVIRGDRTTMVYATVPGSLVQNAKIGSSVTAGQQLIRLHNPSINLAVQNAQADVDRITVTLQGLNQQRSSNAGGSARIASLGESQISAAERLSLQQTQLSQLQIAAPTGGTFTSAAEQLDSTGIRQTVFVRQTSEVLSAPNKGIWIPAGMLLGKIVSSADRIAEIDVPRNTIELVSIGQSVSLFVGSYGRDKIAGNVIEIAAEETRRASSGQTSGPVEAMYRVRVRLNQTAQDLPLNQRTEAKISVQPMSLATRLRRYLSETFDRQL